MGIILGKDDKFIRTNSTFDELMGVKKGEVLGTSMEKFALASRRDKELLKR